MSGRRISVCSYDWTCKSADAPIFYAGNPAAGGTPVAGPWNVNAGEGRQAVAPRTEGIAQALIALPQGADLWISSAGVIGGVIGWTYE